MWQQLQVSRICHPVLRCVVIFLIPFSGKFLVIVHRLPMQPVYHHIGAFCAHPSKGNHAKYSTKPLASVKAIGTKLVECY